MDEFNFLGNLDFSTNKEQKSHRFDLDGEIYKKSETEKDDNFMRDFAKLIEKIEPSKKEKIEKKFREFENKAKKFSDFLSSNINYKLYKNDIMKVEDIPFQTKYNENIKNFIEELLKGGKINEYLNIIENSNLTNLKSIFDSISQGYEKIKSKNEKPLSEKAKKVKKKYFEDYDINEGEIEILLKLKKFYFGENFDVNGLDVDSFNVMSFCEDHRDDIYIDVRMKIKNQNDLSDSFRIFLFYDFTKYNYFPVQDDLIEKYEEEKKVLETKIREHNAFSLNNYFFDKKDTDLNSKFNDKLKNYGKENAVKFLLNGDENSGSKDDHKNLEELLKESEDDNMKTNDYHFDTIIEFIRHRYGLPTLQRYVFKTIVFGEKSIENFPVADIWSLIKKNVNRDESEDKIWKPISENIIRHSFGCSAFLLYDQTKVLKENKNFKNMINYMFEFGTIEPFFSKTIINGVFGPINSKKKETGNIIQVLYTNERIDLDLRLVIKLIIVKSELENTYNKADENAKYQLYFYKKMEKFLFVNLNNAKKINEMQKYYKETGSEPTIKILERFLEDTSSGSDLNEKYKEMIKYYKLENFKKYLDVTLKLNKFSFLDEEYKIGPASELINEIHKHYLNSTEINLVDEQIIEDELKKTYEIYGRSMPEKINLEKQVNDISVNLNPKNYPNDETNIVDFKSNNYLSNYMNYTNYGNPVDDIKKKENNGQSNKIQEETKKEDFGKRKLINENRISFLINFMYAHLIQDQAFQLEKLRSNAKYVFQNTEFNKFTSLKQLIRRFRNIYNQNVANTKNTSQKISFYKFFSFLNLIKIQYIIFSCLITNHIDIIDRQDNIFNNIRDSEKMTFMTLAPLLCVNQNKIYILYKLCNELIEYNSRYMMNSDTFFNILYMIFVSMLYNEDVETDYDMKYFTMENYKRLSYVLMVAEFAKFYKAYESVDENYKKIPKVLFSILISKERFDHYWDWLPFEDSKFLNIVNFNWFSTMCFDHLLTSYNAISNSILTQLWRLGNDEDLKGDITETAMGIKKIIRTSNSFKGNSAYYMLKGAFYKILIYCHYYNGLYKSFGKLLRRFFDMYTNQKSKKSLKMILDVEDIIQKIDKIYIKEGDFKEESKENEKLAKYINNNKKNNINTNLKLLNEYYLTVVRDGTKLLRTIEPSFQPPSYTTENSGFNLISKTFQRRTDKNIDKIEDKIITMIKVYYENFKNISEKVKKIFNSSIYDDMLSGQPDKQNETNDEILEKMKIYIDISASIFENSNLTHDEKIRYKKTTMYGEEENTITMKLIELTEKKKNNDKISDNYSDKENSGEEEKENEENMYKIIKKKSLKDAYGYSVSDYIKYQFYNF